jgi:hypothetical protein
MLPLCSDAIKRYWMKAHILALLLDHHRLLVTLECFNPELLFWLFRHSK